MDKVSAYLQKHFQIPKVRAGNISVACPFHEDDSASASINFEKKLFNCFACNKGYNFTNLYNKLANQETSTIPPKARSRPAKGKGRVKPAEPASDASTHDTGVSIAKLRSAAAGIFRKRGINIQPLATELITDRKHEWFGYLVIQSIDNEALVARDLIGYIDKSIKRKRYMNPEGDKNLFYVDKTDGKIIWLTEGVFDALSLLQLGISNVASVNSASGFGKNADNIAYSLKGKTVLILFDADAPGYKGARKVADKLKEFEVDFSIINLPRTLGRDLNEALIEKKKDLQVFIKAVLTKHEEDDSGFVEMFSDKKQHTNLNILKTGIDPLDKLLTGGFKDGGHIISGETGIGKTTTVLSLALKGAEQKKRILVCSYEVSKRQMWARAASRYDKKTWTEIEELPYSVSDATKKKVKELSKYLRIVVGWPIARVIEAKDTFDVVIIDYIQRVPGVNEGDINGSRVIIDKFTAQLTDLGAMHGKIALIISSLGRQAYSKPEEYGLKESGSLEFMGTTVSRLMKLNENTIVWYVQKNNRGFSDRVKLNNLDLGHCQLQGIKPELFKSEMTK